MANYETVVGLEIHAHLKTDSKMFCSCATGPRGRDYQLSEKDEPNIRICPICTGQPGTLPVPNQKAIEFTILLGLALDAKINPEFNFERKNYFYPDLPKAYQITSATNPPVMGGQLEISLGEITKIIELDHIHLEEDTGKLTHDQSKNCSLVDLNRAGTPLLEIITKPMLSSGKEAVAFMRNLQSILRYLGISDADMEKGQLRCDANVSIRKESEKRLGTKVEIKNMNSFKMIERAVDYESQRQVEVLKEGGRIVQETRGWNDAKGKTFSQRSKEYANDYRYFPEPDIPPIKTGKGTIFEIERIRDSLPELPQEKKNRFIKEYGLALHNAERITSNLESADFFEKVMSFFASYSGEQKRDTARRVSNFIITEFMPKTDSLMGSNYSPKDLAHLFIEMISGKISLKQVKEIFNETFSTSENDKVDIKKIIEEKSMMIISNESELNKIIDQILANFPQEVERYKKGEKKLLSFFMGQIMRETKGQVDPNSANKFLITKLG